MAVVIWVVIVSYDDEDREVYGPYTEAQAERTAAQIQAEVAISDAGDGVNRHPRNVLSAHTMALSRYDAWLTTAERRTVRSIVTRLKRARERRSLTTGS